MVFLPWQLGYHLMPDESYTLQQLLELNLEPYHDQIEKVIDRMSATERADRMGKVFER